MRRSWVGALGAVLVLAVAPAAAGAQQGRTCRQVLPADARRLINAQGQEIYYFLDPVRVLCSGGVRLEADSAVMNRNEATVVLVGDVVYRDSARELTADWANYLARRDQLLARDNVVLRDLESGSRVTGRFLDYLRETESRPVATMIVREGRPHAVIPPREEEPADTGAVATEVWADRMEFRGEESFSAEGDVELVRGGTRGRGDRAVFDQRAERITLIGSAHVEDDRYRLEGERIDAFLRDDEVREVLSREDARVESEEMDVRAERVRIAFDDGRLQRMEAWNPEPETTPRARAFAEEFRLRADSIDARADSAGIREVRAVGRAYGERGADSVAVALPRVVSRDWIQGDTIIGYFSRATPDPPAADTAGPVAAPADSAEVVLERIVVIGGGGPALSLYRMAAEQAGAPPSVNFMKAQRIILFMERGDVARVEAEGPIEGLYLDSSGREPGGSGPTGSAEREGGP